MKVGKTLKDETGITLITLAITIVIIIILSAVVINVSIGDNGLIKKAKETKNTADSAIAEVDSQMNEVLHELINSLVDDKEEAPKGTISFNKLNWAGDGTATIAITTDNLIDQLQYQINSSDGKWTTINNGDIVSGLHHNDTIYARLIRGSFIGTISNFVIKDETPPVVEISTNALTHNSVTLNVNANDGQSGLATSNRYKYYLENTPKSLSNTSSYTYTGLQPSTKYLLKVIVTDNATLTTEKQISIVTSSDPNLVTNRLQEGAWVNYVDGTGVTRKCVVLYGPENANYSSYGIQIVAMDTVGTVQLGNGGVSTMISNEKYFNVAKTSYNNAITTLNNSVQKYLNTTYANSVRCVGSLPNNPLSQSGYYSNNYSYMQNYNGTLRAADNNCITDKNKMASLNILNINKHYWLASRTVESNSSRTDFFLWSISESSGLLGNYLCGVRGSNLYSAYVDCGIRPVFTLKPTVKVTGGNGTQSSPYILGI